MTADPYESTYAGAFIFAVGVLAAEERKDHLESYAPQLLAQNSGDEAIGDLVQRFAGRRFIIEFKRNLESVSSERRKRHKELFAGWVAADRSLAEVGDRGHWMAIGNLKSLHQKASTRFADLWFTPYRVGFNHQRRDVLPQGVDLTTFVRRILANPRAGMSASEFGSYAGMALKAWRTSGGGRSKTTSEIGTLAVAYDQATGTFRFSVCDLFRSLERERDLELGR